MKLLAKKPQKTGESNLADRRVERAAGPSEIRRQVDRAFNRMWQSLGKNGLAGAGPQLAWPAMDMTDESGAIVLRIDAPGLKSENVSVEVTGHLLIIRGSRSEQYQEKRTGWYRHERASGSFYRTVPLPGYVDADKIEARYDQGVITVTIPKKPGDGPRKIPLST